MTEIDLQGGKLGSGGLASVAQVSNYESLCRSHEQRELKFKHIGSKLHRISLFEILISVNGESVPFPMSVAYPAPSVQNHMAELFGYALDWTFADA